jgi:hypothetical protein
LADARLNFYILTLEYLVYDSYLSRFIQIIQPFSDPACALHSLVHLRATIIIPFVNCCDKTFNHHLPINLPLSSYTTLLKLYTEAVPFLRLWLDRSEKLRLSANSSTVRERISNHGTLTKLLSRAQGHPRNQFDQSEQRCFGFLIVTEATYSFPAISFCIHIRRFWAKLHFRPSPKLRREPAECAILTTISATSFFHTGCSSGASEPSSSRKQARQP